MSMNPAAVDDLPEIPGLCDYIDLKDGLMRVRGNRKVYKSIMQSFLRNNNMEIFKNQINANDLKEAEKTVHSIKGVSANMSLTALRKSMIELEQQLKAGSYDEKTCRDAFDNFDKTIHFIAILLQHL